MQTKKKKQLQTHDMVRVWLQTIGQEKPDSPVILDEDIRKFNCRLIVEEVGELIDAMNVEDFQEICDGIFDSLWVITQVAMLYGIRLDHVMSAGFTSNMSKFCRTEEEAIKTINAYREGTHPNKLGERTETYYEQQGDLYVIRRLSDDKVLKSINFKEPDFSIITDKLVKEEI